MEKLTKVEVKWIAAIKDNMMEDHYRRHYGVFEGQPTFDTLYTISRRVIDKLDGWKMMVFYLEEGKLLKRMTKQQKYNETHGEKVSLWGSKEIEPILEEWLWYGARTYLMFITCDELNESAPKEWEKWFDEERKEYGAEEDV